MTVYLLITGCFLFIFFCYIYTNNVYLFFLKENLTDIVNPKTGIVDNPLSAENIIKAQNDFKKKFFNLGVFSDPAKPKQLSGPEVIRVYQGLEYSIPDIPKIRLIQKIKSQLKKDEIPETERIITDYTGLPADRVSVGDKSSVTQKLRIESKPFI